jgi:Spy/CpxP family protein refolding chaperone
VIGAVLLVLLGVFLTVVAFVVWALRSAVEEAPRASQIEWEQRWAEQRIHHLTQRALQQMFDVMKEGL